MLIATFQHFAHLFAMSIIELLNTVFKAKGLRMAAVGSVFSPKCAYYTVELCMFTQQVLPIKFTYWNTPYPNHN